MKKRLLLAFAVALTPALAAQQQSSSTLPGDPQTLLRMAAPFYDYASADMKPWHVRYGYRAFNQQGHPEGEGTFDFWSMGKITKASWTQGDVVSNEWQTAGKKFVSGTTTGIPSLTHRLYGVFRPGFLSMLEPSGSDRPLKSFSSQSSSSAPLTCVGSVRPAAADKVLSLDSTWPAYCFSQNGQDPVLSASHENGTLVNIYSHDQKFQSHYFPGDIEIRYVGTKRVEANLQVLEEVAPDNSAFTPSADAKAPVPPKSITVPLITVPTVMK